MFNVSKYLFSLLKQWVYVNYKCFLMLNDYVYGTLKYDINMY